MPFRVVRYNCRNSVGVCWAFSCGALHGSVVINPPESHLEALSHRNRAGFLVCLQKLAWTYLSFCCDSPLKVSSNSNLQTVRDDHPRSRLAPYLITGPFKVTFEGCDVSYTIFYVQRCWIKRKVRDEKVHYNQF